MTSYLVYAVARFVVYKRLICKGEVRNGPRQHKVYECYPQLNMHKIEHYRRVNDAFTMYIIRLLQGGIHKGLSKEATKLVEKYGSWHIQFPTFTYLRIRGFRIEPYRLPMYLTDKIILLEVVRQLLDYDFLQKEKHRTRITLPIALGKTLEVCHTTISPWNL